MKPMKQSDPQQQTPKRGPSILFSSYGLTDTPFLRRLTRSTDMKRQSKYSAC